MSNLTPERRMDKNGRVVTRHVKPDGCSKATAFTPPPPAVISPRDAATELLLQPFSSSTYTAVDNFLAGCRESTVLKAAEVISGADSELEAYVIGEVVMKRDEDFLIAVTGSAHIWTTMAKSLHGDDGKVPERKTRSFLAEMFGVYRSMSAPETVPDTVLLKVTSNTEFDGEELAESFAVELLGTKLMLSAHSKTSRGYFKSLDLLSEDLEGVAAITNELLEINYSTQQLDRYGNGVITPLQAKEVMTLVRLSREYPGRIKDISEFVCERKRFDEDMVREFLSADGAALTRGLL